MEPRHDMLPHAPLTHNSQDKTPVAEICAGASSAPSGYLQETAISQLVLHFLT